MKLLFLFLLFVSLSGCSMFSGNYTETPIVKDGEVLTNRFGVAHKEKKRIARSVSIMEQAAVAIEHAKDIESINPCLTLTFEQINQLKADAQEAYINQAGMCNLMATMERTVSQALGRPQSTQEAIARAFVQSVLHVENGMTGRVKAVANPFAITVGVKSIATSFEEVGKSKGNTTVGNINVSDSGDSVGGEGNTTTNTASTNLIIGDNNSTSTAFDNASSGENLLNVGASSSGSQVIDSKSQGQQTAEEIQAAAPTNDEDGIKF